MVTRADVVVLGAGMVGVSVALHLQRRGRDVVLVDRRGAGEETSYGNAGLIQREAVFPYTFPREIRHDLELCDEPSQ
jgi:D-amino-acid dehydrogenase